MAGKYKKRPDGRYLVQVLICYKPDGRPKFKNIYAKTIAELEKKEREFRMNLDRGIVVDDLGLTVGDWADKWLQLYKCNVSYNTREMYRIMIEAHIKPSIGSIRLCKLKTYHVQQLINDKASLGLTRTLEKIKLTLDQIIKQAILCEFIYKNIMLGVSLPPKVKIDKRSLSSLEISAVLSADLPLKEKAFLFTLLFAGLRRGEILALTIADIDFINFSISVNKVVYFEGNKPVLRSGTKSSAGVRLVPMPDILARVLKLYVDSLVDSFVLFPSNDRQIMSAAVFRRFWYKTMALVFGPSQRVNKPPSCCAADTGSVTPHVFRHTYATLLYNSNIDTKLAQYFLGHANFAVTMDIYTHLDDHNKSLARSKLNLFVNLLL